MTKKRVKTKKRIGTLTCAIKYVVDIDDPEMVEHAKDCFYEDVFQAIVKTSDRAEFEAMLEVKLDPKLKEKDINEFLLEEV